jgi:L-alanine-DL-glutamate epimerase-like enolase superfamily enzyme
VLSAIRDAVGDRIEVMLEGHGQWQVAAATRILRAAEQFDVFWAEDMTLAHDPRALGTLAAATRIPLAASEYLMGRWQFRQVLETSAIGYVHLDPSWCGGITEAQRILAIASSFGVVSCMHDCTGPMNLLAGLHLASANDTVGYQEVLRAFLTDVYPSMVDTEWVRRDGRLLPPNRPGLGADLTGQYLAQEGLLCRASDLQS